MIIHLGQFYIDEDGDRIMDALHIPNERIPRFDSDLNKITCNLCLELYKEKTKDIINQNESIN